MKFKLDTEIDAIQNLGNDLALEEFFGHDGTPNWDDGEYWDGNDWHYFPLGNWAIRLGSGIVQLRDEQFRELFPE